jgi:hypothetical protein
MMNRILRMMDPSLLLPKENVEISVDRNYLLSAIGVLSMEYPLEAKNLLLELIARDQL